MDPESTVVRHLSIRRTASKKTSIDKEPLSVPGNGKDNEGYDGSTDNHINLMVSSKISE